MGSPRASESKVIDIIDRVGGGQAMRRLKFVGRFDREEIVSSLRLPKGACVRIPVAGLRSVNQRTQNQSSPMKPLGQTGTHEGCLNPVKDAQGSWHCRGKQTLSIIGALVALLNQFDRVNIDVLISGHFARVNCFDLKALIRRIERMAWIGVKSFAGENPPNPFNPVNLC